ncbi:chromate transporter [Cohnella fermenti]|uniref:Chromate transporter n=1 Tax=Cohnella fermenti TaxID=2565925 RepID=A0A4S4BGS0_9BACL|nr:chromate transporter [Cohnella fermenti]THF73448.1 chromate transporter [Cohnella fermenti]
MLKALLLAFLKIGLFSFGGGYAVLPSIQAEVEGHGWLTQDDFARAISIAAMSPGSIATNGATLIGYRIDGFGGALAATVGILLPSLVLIVLVAMFFYRMRDSKWMRYVLYSLRPIITMLILYAAIRLLGIGGGSGGGAAGLNWTFIATLLIIGGCVFGMLRYKLHPVLVIVASGLTGIVLF